MSSTSTTSPWSDSLLRMCSVGVPAAMLRRSAALGIGDCFVEEHELDQRVALGALVRHDVKVWDSNRSRSCERHKVLALLPDQDTVFDQFVNRLAQSAYGYVEFGRQLPPDGINWPGSSLDASCSISALYAAVKAGRPRGYSKVAIVYGIACQRPGNRCDFRFHRKALSNKGWHVETAISRLLIKMTYTILRGATP